jgi:copper(I)-binding protein
LLPSRIARHLLGVLAATLIVGSAEAKDAQAGSLLITGAWSRPTSDGALAGIGYVAITNTGPRADRLIGASSTSAGRTELHDMSFNNGIMQMRPVDGGIVIPAGRTVRLAPSGYHVMLIDPKHPFVAGKTIPVILRFERAGSVTVAFDVRVAPSMADAGAKRR